MTTETAALPTAAPREAARVAWGYLVRRPLTGAITIATLIAATTVALLAPRVIGNLIDNVVAHDRSAVNHAATILAIIAVSQAVLRAAGTWLVARWLEPALGDMRCDTLDCVLLARSRVIDGAGSGEVLGRVNGDVERISIAIREVVPTLVGAVLTLVITLINLVLIDWRFALAALAAAPSNVVTLRWYLRTSPPLFRAEREANGELSQAMLGSIAGVETVRVLGLGDTHAERIRILSLKTLSSSLRAMHYRTRFYGRMHIAEVCGVTAVLAAGFMLVRADLVTVGAASASALYFIRLYEPMNMLLILSDSAMEAGASLTRMVGVLTLGADIAESQVTRRGAGELEVSQVFFGYNEGHDVLHDVTLSVAAGEEVALVGASGAGKSTIARLVAGLERPRRGSVQLDGERIGPGATADQGVTLITQEIHVFAGTLLDDLRLARRDLTSGEAEAIFRQLGSWEWISRLPDGLATPVGAGGHPLTAMQEQEIALARLMAIDPVIAVLDEATAEAGSAGAKHLESAVGMATGQRTSLTIAHRLSQARRADRIIVLDDGEIVESGTHDELVRLDGRYGRLWAAWTHDART